MAAGGHQGPRQKVSLRLEGTADKVSKEGMPERIAASEPGVPDRLDCVRFFPRNYMGKISVIERGVDHLDLLVISHHHLDHYGGADGVIRAFPPRLFLATDIDSALVRYERHRPRMGSRVQSGPAVSPTPHAPCPIRHWPRKVSSPRRPNYWLPIFGRDFCSSSIGT
jgi:hypothetical protein